MTEGERKRASGEFFREAVGHISDVIPSWRMQVEYAVKHPVELVVDWDSLGGDYDAIEAFMHQVISGALGAVSKVGFETKSAGRLEELVRRVVIGAAKGEESGVEVKDGELRIWGSLERSGGAPIEEMTRLIEEALGTGAPDQGKRPEEDKMFGFGNRRRNEAGEYAKRLEAVLKEVGLWPGDRPAGEIEVKGAFGRENMAFEQWLAWVLIPRLEDIAEGRGDFPKGSAVAVYAVRELSGVPGEEEVLEVLAEIDGEAGG